jgi:hypothetical protein
MYIEAIVRFDAREMDTNFAETWSPQRQATFLLRTDLDKPLSTDSWVWESMFGRTRIEFSDWAYETVYPTPRIELPKWTGSGQDTRESLEQMQAFMSEHQAELDGKRYWTIAITQCVSPEEAATWYPIPPEVQPEWSLLGYDVSDYSRLSGLMNCGYTAEDGDLRGQWASKLNRYHLFEKVEDALDYARLTDGRVKEHAPFSAYGIYVIERYG